MTVADLLQVLAGLLLVGGGVFCLVAAIGVVRLQDAILRMHASSKAGTVGCGLVLLAVALVFPDVGTVTRAMAAIAFLLVSTPIASHMIGRAAYASGTKLWSGTVADELRGTPDDPCNRLKTLTADGHEP
ncbi:monovalent cation/H(+) antiporter subunit G [Aerophototrophica crusticola]|uniref:Monovalent cation/H(+) antiporter subunit G n=1 Tax=Aerophototrophica crusticola TaxID=1709002 RepID=A0A858R8J4_9PROT|nr:monovalent cation/H(+) antiporter subunit G [Rhodospirillaceae bacterium B3]